MWHPTGLAGVLATFGGEYLATHTLSTAQCKVWRAIVACRTAALGGHVERCSSCDATRHIYHSCRNRHWRALTTALFAQAWVVYAKAPLGGPAQVLEYLGRYTHRVAISNERIIAINGNSVAFRVRADGGSGKKRTLGLAGTLFIERFLLHVLPAGFKRIRHYGLLGAARKREGLAAARRALDVPTPVPSMVESIDDFWQRVARIDIERCGHCRVGRWQVISVITPSGPSPLPRAPP